MASGGPAPVAIFCGHMFNTGSSEEPALAARIAAELDRLNVGVGFGPLACGADILVAHMGLTKLEVVANMHERKARMFDLSDAFIALPGGFGTLDEMFEMLTWRQLGLGDKPCAFLDVDGFYAPLAAMMDRMVEERFLHPDQRRDLWHGDDLDTLFAWMREYEPAHAAKWIDEKRRKDLR